MLLYDGDGNHDCMIDANDLGNGTWRSCCCILGMDDEPVGTHF